MMKFNTLWFKGFAICIVLLSLNSAEAQTTATFTGGGNGTSYNDPANWSINAVPINSGGTTYRVVIPNGRNVQFDVPGASNAVFQLTVASGATFNMNPGRQLSVTDSASYDGLINVNNGSLLAPSPASVFPGGDARINVNRGTGTTTKKVVGVSYYLNRRGGCVVVSYAN